jgi:hypothetical protein
MVSSILDLEDIPKILCEKEFYVSCFLLFGFCGKNNFLRGKFWSGKEIEGVEKARILLDLKYLL